LHKLFNLLQNKLNRCKIIIKYLWEFTWRSYSHEILFPFIADNIHSDGMATDYLGIENSRLRHFDVNMINNLSDSSHGYSGQKYFIEIQLEICWSFTSIEANKDKSIVAEWTSPNLSEEFILRILLLLHQISLSSHTILIHSYHLSISKNRQCFICNACQSTSD